MILGIISIPAFTTLHVIISLIAIATGIIVVVAWLYGRRMPGTTALFLLTTVLTSVTGFLFPIKGFTPAIGVGILSMVLLVIALFSIYSLHLRGSWRWIYIVTATAALWFNVFVLIAQAFLKIPSLHVLAPAGNEPPFLIVQGAALVLFVVLGLLALIKFHPAPPLAAGQA
jgi:hypothetical protein